MAWFRHKDDDESMDPQVLLARADAASPTVSIAKAPAGFRMTISDVFSIKGRGTVVTGTIEAGSVDTGDTVRLTRADGSTRDVTIDGIEAFRKCSTTASAGAIVGLLLKSSHATTSPAATSCPLTYCGSGDLAACFSNTSVICSTVSSFVSGKNLATNAIANTQSTAKHTSTQSSPIARCDAGNDSISA